MAGIDRYRDGCSHAHRHGPAIVVSDPNHLENKMLRFFADAVEEMPLQAARALCCEISKGH